MSSTDAAGDATVNALPRTRSSGKKGKKFPDHANMLNLIDTITTREESKISAKLQRQHRISKLDTERTQKKRDRTREKRAEIEVVKKELREKEKERKKRKRKVNIEEEDKENPPKKRVSFQV